MKAVVVAAEEAPTLWPLTEVAAAPLLPVADKPLLVHALESLALAGMGDVVVITGSSGDEVKGSLGNGSQWGMRLDFLKVGRGESLRDVLRRVAAEINGDHLLVDSTHLRTPIIGEFLRRAAEVRCPAVTATIKGAPAGLMVLRRSSCSASGNGSEPPGLSDEPAKIDFPDARVLRIDSAGALHRANLDLIDGRFPGLLIGGRELRPGMRVGRHSRVSARAIKGAPVFIGARCRVASSAELWSHTVVSSDSVIDRDVTLYRAVIMPDTYVGKLVEVSDAIVAGNLLIHVHTGTHARVTDLFLLSRIQKRSIAAVIRSSVARALDRIQRPISERSRSLSSIAAAPNKEWQPEIASPGDSREQLESSDEFGRRIQHPRLSQPR